MDNAHGQSVTNDVLHPLMNRLDRIENNLVASSRDDVASLKSTVVHVQQARVQEVEDQLIAEALASAPRAPVAVPATHRGPGASGSKQDVPPPSMPVESVTANIARNAPLWTETDSPVITVSP